MLPDVNEQKQIVPSINFQIVIEMKRVLLIIAVAISCLASFIVQGQTPEPEVPDFFETFASHSKETYTFVNKTLMNNWYNDGEYLLLITNDPEKGVVDVDLMLFDGNRLDFGKLEKGSQGLIGVNFSESLSFPQKKAYYVPIVIRVGESYGYDKEVEVSEAFRKFVVEEADGSFDKSDYSVWREFVAIAYRKKGSVPR